MGGNAAHSAVAERTGAGRQGEPIAEVAASLHLSQGTVRNYMASVIRKVGARNRVDAIRIAQGAGWT
ncbi:response regulator transcription factor [Streptomyces sp. NPDC002835]